MDKSAVKDMLMAEFMENNPTPEEQRSFYLGMVYMEEALYNPEDTDERLNDYVPQKLINKYLQIELEGVKDLVALNEKLKSEINGLKNILKNNEYLSKAEIRELRKNKEYQRVVDELAAYRRHCDFWCEMAAKSMLKEKMKQK